MIKYSEIKYMRSADFLGVLSPKDLVTLANKNLKLPIDKLLLGLALCETGDINCIESTKYEIYKRENLLEISRIEALRYFAFHICYKIMENSIPAIEGAKLISRVAIAFAAEDEHELDPFVYASSEIDDRPEDKTFFSLAIEREAKDLVDRYGSYS